MANFGDVRKWDPEPLHVSVGELNRRCDQLLGLADELDAASQPSGWVGDAAYAAAMESRRRTDKLEEQVAGVAAVRRALGEAADAISALRHAVAEIDGLAGANGFAIADTGAVIEHATVGQPRDLERVKAELVDRVEQVLRRAQDIDDDLTTVVNRARAKQTLDGDQTSLASAAEAGTARGGLSTVGPPQGSVYDNAGWWDGLSAVEQQQIIKDHPDWIGNRDGIPAVARDAANRARLVTERAAIQPKVDELEAKIRAIQTDRHRDPRAKMLDIMPLSNELARAKAKLDAIESMEKILRQPDRQLLLMDLSGDHPKAAIASGNVGTADHVAVFTPGMNSQVGGGVLAGYVNDMYLLRVQSESELRKYGGGGTVATVAWLGYEPPSLSENPWDAAGEGLARDGANRLVPFLNGIDASRDNDPHLTALGHSYGSTTTGLALQQNTGVDDAVVFGSPGLGTNDPGRIMVQPGHMYNLEADGDLVADLGDENFGHGRDPSKMPIPQLSTHDAIAPDGRQLHASHGHSEYTWNDTTSQYNMSVIVAGMNDRIISAR
jgi:hypothetical protein